MKKEISALRSDSPFKSITDNLIENNFKFEYKILDLSIIESNRIISEYLNIPLASKVLSYKKMRIIEDIPTSIEQVYIEYRKVIGLENINLENKSLYKTLKDMYNYEVHRSEEELLVVKATEEEKELLKLENDDYVNFTRGISYLSNNSILEYYELISRYDFFKYRSVISYEW